MNDGTSCIDRDGNPEAPIATPSGLLLWKIQARYAVREMECASRAPLSNGADEVADNLPASLSVWPVISLVLA